MNRPITFRILAAALALIGDPVAESAYADRSDPDVEGASFLSLCTPLEEHGDESGCAGMAHASRGAAQDASREPIAIRTGISGRMSVLPVQSMEPDGTDEKANDCDPVPAVLAHLLPNSVSNGAAWRSGRGHGAFLALISPHSHTPFPTIENPNHWSLDV
ncbi:MAG: hypothetical protein ABIY63_05870 [Fibrobacteria bacterium]